MGLLFCCIIICWRYIMNNFFLSQLYSKGFVFSKIDKTILLSYQSQSDTTKSPLSVNQLVQLDCTSLQFIIPESLLSNCAEYLDVINLFVQHNFDEATGSQFIYAFINDFLDYLTVHKNMNNMVNFLSKDATFNSNFITILFCNIISTKDNRISKIIKPTVRKNNNYSHFKNILLLKFFNIILRSKNIFLINKTINYIEEKNISQFILTNKSFSKLFTNIFNLLKNKEKYPSIVNNMKLLNEHSYLGKKSFPFITKKNNHLHIPLRYFHLAHGRSSMRYFYDIFLMFCNLESNLSLIIGNNKKNPNELTIYNHINYTRSDLSLEDKALFNSDRHLLLTISTFKNSDFLWDRASHVDIIIECGNPEYTESFLRLFNYAIYDTLMNTSYNNSSGYQFYQEYKHQLEYDYLENLIETNEVCEKITKF